MEDYERLYQQAKRLRAAFAATGDPEMERQANIFEAEARHSETIFKRDQARGQAKEIEDRIKKRTAEINKDLEEAKRRAEQDRIIREGDAKLRQAIEDQRRAGHGQRREDERDRRRDDPHNR